MPKAKVTKTKSGVEDQFREIQQQRFYHGVSEAIAILSKEFNFDPEKASKVFSVRFVEKLSSMFENKKNNHRLKKTL